MFEVLTKEEARTLLNMLTESYDIMRAIARKDLRMARASVHPETRRFFFSSSEAVARMATEITALRWDIKYDQGMATRLAW
jgi:hypothetical protein